MSAPSRTRPLRRLASPNTTLAIVVAVPLAASCLLGAPLLSTAARPAASPVVETAATVPERQRRAIEFAFQVPAPHDPPGRIAPWSRDKSQADDHADAREQVESRRLHAAAKPGIPPSQRLPKSSAALAAESRGPPPRGHMGC